MSTNTITNTLSNPSSPILAPALSPASVSSSPAASSVKSKFVEEFDLDLGMSALNVSRPTTPVSVLQSPASLKDGATVGAALAQGAKGKAAEPATSVAQLLKKIVLFGLGYTALGIALVVTSPLILTGVIVLATGIMVEETAKALRALFSARNDQKVA